MPKFTLENDPKFHFVKKNIFNIFQLNDWYIRRSRAKEVSTCHDNLFLKSSGVEWLKQIYNMNLYTTLFITIGQHVLAVRTMTLATLLLKQSSMNNQCTNIMDTSITSSLQVMGKIINGSPKISYNLHSIFYHILLAFKMPNCKILFNLWIVYVTVD